MSPSDPDSSASRRQALAENPAIADCFFFMKEFVTSLKNSMWAFLEPLTICCGLNGNTVVALMSMALHGYPMSQTFSTPLNH